MDNNALIRNDITFEDVFKEWWDVHSKTIKRSTRYSKLSKFKKHILPHFGKLKIKDITKAYCQKVINRIAQDIDSVQDVKIQANLVFKYALRMDYITRNPMEFVVIPKKKRIFYHRKKRNGTFGKKTKSKPFSKKLIRNLNNRIMLCFMFLFLPVCVRGTSCLGMEGR
ncbi:N-terminal phage integrase SAM-like domain-containing protein [Bacillus licheniformis]